MSRRGEAGAATVELVLLSVVLLVPFVYALLAVAQVQRAAYAVAGASRESGRMFVTAPDSATGADRAELATRLALQDQGVDGEADLDLRCSASPCLQPGARVTTVVTVRVRLPLIPAFGDALPPGVRVRARHVEVVDAFVGSRS